MTTLEGHLLKDGGWRRGWRKRYFKLTKIYFQYFENQCSTSPKGAAVRGTIQNVELVDLKTYAFKVTFKSEVWDLQASSTQELIQWMEAIKPKSAASVISSQQLNTSLGQNNRTTSFPTHSVTTIQPETSEHAYQPLPLSFTQNPRLSMGSDGRSSPSNSTSPRVREVGTIMNRVHSVPNEYQSGNCNWTTSNSSARSHSSVRSTSPHPNSPQINVQTIDYQDPLDNLPSSSVPNQTSHNSSQPGLPTNTTPQNSAPPPDLDLSDDEFLDFGDEGTYMNDPQETLHTLRREIKTLRLSDGNRTAVERPQRVETPVVPAVPAPSVVVIPETPDGTLNAEYVASLTIPSEYSDLPGQIPEQPSHYDEKPEYINDGCHGDAGNLGNSSLLVEEEDGGFDSYSSPAVTRRSIKSKNITGNVNYSVTVPSSVSEDDSEGHLPKVSIKSTAPATTDHTLHRDNSSTSFLSASPPPANRITTLRIQEWVRKITLVKKAFVDPDDQEVGALDKFLMDNTTCLPKENFTLLQKIGNGAFGEVWKARCETAVNGDDMVAVKCLKEGASDKHRHDFYGEAALLGQFRHANVIALHGVILRDSSPWIVIEYAENGALKSFLKKHGEDRHSNQLLNYCRDIVRGMKYLSERGYIHRDLAARNVLLTRMEVCKIADFGLSRKLGDDDDIYVSRGGMVAIKWTAPEGVLGASYSSASDVWSCGITMWEVFSDGANPWSGQSNEDAFRRIRKGGRLAKPEKCPLDVYKTILKCWEANPLDRPTFADLDRLLYDPSTDIVEQPLYENTDGYVQYVNLQYENMQDVQRT
ncbi:hypothetical protein ACHWQZ_G006110 [Mnemiopsis leidyi]